MAFTAKVRQVGDVAVVDLNGRITLGESTGQLRDELRSLMAKGTKNILLNLQNVSYVDSAGLFTRLAMFRMPLMLLNVATSWL